MAAAEAVVARDGIDALTMRRVARELGSSPMALYRHVRDKDELLVLLLDRLAARMPRPILPDDPRGRLLSVWTLLHDALAEHPWIVGVLAAGDLMAPAVLPLVEQIYAASVACGLTLEEAAGAYRAVWQFTVGELTIRTASARRARELDRPPFQLTAVELVDPAAIPTLLAAAPHRAAARDRDTYAEGLVALVDGFLARAGLDTAPEHMFVYTYDNSARRRRMAGTTGAARDRFRATATPNICVHDGAAALDFYTRAFGATETMRLMQPDGRVGHAEIEIEGAPIMLSDEFPDLDVRSPKSLGGSPVMIALQVADVDAFFERATAAGATVHRPIADQFYGEREGQLTDPFGYRWDIMTHIEDVSPEEMQRRIDAMNTQV